MSDKNLVLKLESKDVKGVIHELSMKAGELVGVDGEEIYNSVWKREQLMRTGIGNGLAVPHARLDGLTKSYVFVRAQ